VATMNLPDPGPPNLEFERPADRVHLERAAAALAARGFKAQVVNGAEQARQIVLEASRKAKRFTLRCRRRCAYWA
jgi:hypothetical protein